MYQDTIQLYMVLDGHDGDRAVKFAQSNIPHFLLHSELVGGDKTVMEALRRSIVNTEREFFIGIDHYITRKVTLQLEIEVLSYHVLLPPPSVPYKAAVASTFLFMYTFSCSKRQLTQVQLFGSSLLR